MIFFKKIISITKKIPRGRVATYGQIAALAGSPRGARTVGWALHGLPEKELQKVPWHRVINREGRVSTTCMDHPGEQQAMLLKKENIAVQYRNGNYFIDLKKYLWSPTLSPLKIRGE